MTLIEPDRKSQFKKLLYVTKWDWKDLYEKVSFQGHPRVGRVYRASFSTETNAYSILINDELMIAIPALINNEPEFAYSSEITEVTISNILDLNLTEEDLDNILKWTEAPKNQLVKLGEAMQQQEKEDQNVMFEASKVMMDLYQINPVQFEILLNVANYLNEENIDDMDDPAIPLAYGKSGTSLNLARTLRAIKNYTSNDRRTNENVKDLIEGIIGLVVEYERVLIQE